MVWVGHANLTKKSMQNEIGRKEMLKWKEPAAHISMQQLQPSGHKWIIIHFICHLKNNSKNFGEEKSPIEIL